MGTWILRPNSSNSKSEVTSEVIGSLRGHKNDLRSFPMQPARLKGHCPLVRLGIGLERLIYGCRSVSRVEKIHFAYTNDTFCVSMGLETVSESVLKDTLMCSRAIPY